LKDKSIVWLSVGGVMFWLAILNPGPTAKILKASKQVVDSMVSQVRFAGGQVRRSGS